MLEKFHRVWHPQPPPIREFVEALWCGALKGLLSISFPLVFKSPATLWILVISRASVSLSSGKIVGIRLAIMDLPHPGEPSIRMLCPPAAATTINSITVSWPRTSLKSIVSGLMSVLSSGGRKGI